MSVIDIIFICFIGSGLTLTLITIRQRKANKYLQDLSSATKIVTKNEYSEIGIAMRAGEYLVKCPDCAEFIKLEANVCKNCNRDVSTFTHTKREELTNLSELKTLARESKDAANKSTGKRVAVVFLVVLGSYLLIHFVSIAISNNNAENAAADRTSAINSEYSIWEAAVSRCGYDFGITKDESADAPMGTLEIGTTVVLKDMANFWTTNQGVALDCFTRTIYGYHVSKYFSVNESEAANFVDRYLYDTEYTDASFKGLVGSEKGFYHGEMWKNEGYGNYTITLHWDYPLP